MKPLAIILVILCVAALAGVGWLWFSAELTVSGTDCLAADAMDQADAFRGLISSVADGSFTGTLFGAAGREQPEDCVYYTYTLRLRNATFLPARAVELQISPMEGDLLQLPALSRRDLAARSEGEFQVTLLTSREMHNIREITVTWYFWGLPFSTRITYHHSGA